MEEYRLEEAEYIELSSLLKLMGLCESGGMAKTVIAAGKVSVDGSVELRKRRKVRAGQVVEFDGRSVAVR
ncbi:MAG: RNA-binding S4 domain-containing protein [Nitrospirales bacterium]|nr:RNA-binding S4 domain-containing protein [Nitrospirales bacterium]